MTDAGLTWAVKDSFVAYVSSLADGEISTSDGATTTSDGTEFHFPLVGVDGLEADGSAGRLRFGGTITFAGHWGMLQLTLGNPVLTLGPGSSQLLAEIRGQLRPLADLPAMRPERDDAGLSWAGWIPALTSDGAREFQGTYAAGEELAPLEVRAPLSDD